MTVTINGTTGIDKVQDAVVQNVTLAAGVPSKAKLPAGTVLQVVQAANETQTSTSSATPVSANLSASITPTSSTNKILVTVSLSGLANSGAQLNLSLYKNGSSLTGPYKCGQSGSVWGTYSFTYLDSPATTSSITYALYMALGNGIGGPVYVGTGDSTTGGKVNAITLMEIAA